MKAGDRVKHYLYPEQRGTVVAVERIMIAPDRSEFCQRVKWDEPRVVETLTDGLYDPGAVLVLSPLELLAEQSE